MHSFFFFWDASEHTCKPAAVECVYSCHRCWYWRALHIHVSLQRQKRVGFLFPCGFSPIQVIVIWWHFSVTVTYLAHLESQVGANSSWYDHQMEKLKKPSSNEFRSRRLNLVLGRCKRDQFSSSVLKWVWEEWKGRFRVLATPCEQRCFVVSPEWNRLWVVRLTSHWAGRLFLHPAIITGEMGSLKVEPSSAGAPAKYQVGRPVLSPADLLGWGAFRVLTWVEFLST